MKYIYISSIIMLNLFGFAVAPNIYAKNENKSNLFNRETRKEASNSVAPKNFKPQNLENRIATKVGALKNFLSSRVILNNVKVISVGSNTLTITDKDGKSIVVNLDTNTRLRRRFYGTAKISEISVNNIINVFGKWVDDTHTSILAQQIRNLSIQKRFGVFIGDITAINGNNITLKTINRGSQNVTVTGSTKFVDRGNKSIVQTDILVGQRIRVKGMWDSSNSTITEVTQVKDYNLPVKVKPTAGVTQTPSPTIAPTVSPTP
jgi:hypothetical protein